MDSKDKIISKCKILLDAYHLGKLGYNKLLSKGKVNKKLKISVKYASKKVVEAVKKSGGEVILLKK